MSDAVGFLSKLGIKNVAGWASGYTAVDTAIPFTSETFSPNWSRIEKEALVGYGGKEPSEQGNFGAPGALNFELDYNNFGPIFKMVLGLESPAGTFSPAEQLAVYNWLEFEKQVSRHRFGAAMFGKITLSGDQGGLVKGSIDGFARSFINSATAFPSISPATMTRVRFQDLTFRLGDQLNVLVSGDAFAINHFEITFDRGLKGDDYVARSVDSTKPIQPIEDGFRECSFSITLPRYAADTIVDWKESDTALQADFSFIRGSGIVIQFPEVRISEGFGAPIGGPGVLTLEGGFNTFRSSSGNPMYVGNEIKIILV